MRNGGRVTPGLTNTERTALLPAVLERGLDADERVRLLDQLEREVAVGSPVAIGNGR